MESKKKYIINHIIIIYYVTIHFQKTFIFYCFLMVLFIVKDTTVHPDTGQKIFPLFRMSAFVPANIFICAGLLAPGVLNMDGFILFLTKRFVVNESSVLAMGQSIL